MKTVDTFLSESAKLVGSPERLGALLAVEKKRRGLPEDRLLFVGLANVALVHWCAMQAVLKSRARESESFAAYLHDRLVYASRLRLAQELPQADKDILAVGGSITLADVETLLRQEAEAKRQRDERSGGARGRWLCEDSQDKEGRRTRLINPALPDWEQTLYREEAAAEGIRLIGLEDDPRRRGELLQADKAERHPTIRWNFSWERYVLVGTPDGITGGFVYEFKTTRNAYLGGISKPVATAQADLYGRFFRRPVKRVQTYIMEEGRMDTSETPVDEPRAKATLAIFRQVDEGALPRPPSPTWKCKKCDFRAQCPICPLGLA
jgi:hypothetical protein